MILSHIKNFKKDERKSLGDLIGNRIMHVTVNSLFNLSLTFYQESDDVLQNESKFPV